ncbi:M3 family oligoendopeptidase [Candidatus Pacearchaeota archaeon]|nr:M3 family oligoendopeptidase [Candidatus Pacearchaeota archaeon]
MENIEIKKTEWDLSPLFSGDADFKLVEYRKQIKEKIARFVNKWRDREDYLSNPAILKEALDEYEDLDIVGSGGDGSNTRDGFYFWLRTQQDQSDPEIKAKYNKSIEFSTNLNNEITFFKLNLAKIKSIDQENILKSKELFRYKHFLERVFAESKYLLTEKEEKIINLKNTTSHSKWEEMLSTFLSKEEREVINKEGNKELKSFSEILTLMNEQNKEVRDSAAKAFNEILLKHEDVAEVEINALLANKKVDDELRNSPRPDFLRHLSDDIDSDIVDVLIKSVSERFDIPNIYYQLKAKLFGVKKLEYHERNVSYGEIDKEYSYKDAILLINLVFDKLDVKFSQNLKKLIENSQIDVYPKKGKRQGAFCTDSLLSQPTYVLLNYTNKLNDVTTIAHEIGHAINSELMKEKQNALNCAMPLSTAEVASTFMEDFVLDELMKNANDNEKLSLLMMKLNDLVSTIFRQIACYNFEKELHSNFREKGFLSKEEIGSLFLKHMNSYMGPFIEQSAGSENWWVYWHHIRRFFYVYSYSSGLLISKTLQANVKKDKSYIEKVKNFLSSGSSDSPKNIFLKLGIDITRKEFWEKGINEINSLLNETENLAKKLGKLN